MDLVKEGPCGNVGWCTHCSSLALKENPKLLESLDEILLDNFKYIQQITVLLEAPKESPYDGQTLQLDIDIPDEYPKKPIQCYFKQSILHINVSQSKQEDAQGYQIMFKQVTKKHWQRNYQIFQIIMTIIELLKTPDDSEFYFTKEHMGTGDFIAENEKTYKEWKENKEMFIQRVSM